MAAAKIPSLENEYAASLARPSAHANPPLERTRIVHVSLYSVNTFQPLSEPLRIRKEFLVFVVLPHFTKCETQFSNVKTT